MQHHEAETSPAKKSGKIHAQKVTELVHRANALLKEAFENLEENPTKKALSLIEIAESELESVRESVIVGLTELTVLGLQQVEDLSEALRQEIDVELWGSTVESRAKFVETKISYLQSPRQLLFF
jgi:superoxide dismutase